MSASRVLRGASRTLLRTVATRSRSLPQQSLAASRRCVSSLNVESQQKVREPGSTPVADESAPANQKTATQLLATHLKEADPAMYDIIENASSRIPPERKREKNSMLTTFRHKRTGEEKTKALYQPHSLRELHITGGAGCPGQSHAKYETLGSARVGRTLAYTWFNRQILGRVPRG